MISKAFLAIATLAVSATVSAEFKVDADGLLSGHELTPVIATPGESLELSLLGAQQPSAFSPSVELATADSHSWLAISPHKHGSYPVHFTSASGTTKSVQLIVTEPFEHQRELNGYRIGKYPSPKGSPNPARYGPPKGFIELTEQNLHTPLSSHFQLHQFMCKQGGSWPRYMVVQPTLVVMLENIVAMLNRRGIAVDTLAVLSGYRTPLYNKAIGNVPYSRHVFGDAADIFVDADGDNFMDDLNGDGVVSVKDAQLLADMIGTLPGAKYSGIGVYAATKVRGPFVHVDTRGKRARWEG